MHKDCLRAIHHDESAMAACDHLNDRSIHNWPIAVEAILRETADIGFSMASESQTGSLLRTFAASRPAGRFLELGTGTGIATAWLLDGMDQASHLHSVDNDPTVVAIARRHLGSDPRVTFHLDDGATFIERQTAGSYDFVFADAWPGKFSHLEQALALVLTRGASCAKACQGSARVRAYCAETSRFKPRQLTQQVMAFSTALSYWQKWRP